jgi:hypothetical protein
LFLDCWKEVFPGTTPEFNHKGAPKDYSEDSRFFDPVSAAAPSKEPSAGPSGLSGPQPLEFSSALQPQTPSFAAPPSSPSPRASTTALQPQTSSFVIPPSSPAPAASALRSETPEGDDLVQYLRYYDYPVELRPSFSTILGGLIPDFVDTDPSSPIRIVIVENPEQRIPDNGEKPESFITAAVIDVHSFGRISAVFPKCIAKNEERQVVRGSVACYLSTWVSLYLNDKFYHVNLPASSFWQSR